MNRLIRIVGLGLAASLAACGSGNYNGGSGAAAQSAPAVGGSSSGSGSGTGSSGGSCTVATSHARPVALVAPGSDSATQAYFNANVEPNVQSGNCRVCHTAGGLANQPGYPITNQLTLSSDTTQDYANFVAAWQNLPQPANVTQNDLLTYPTGGNGHPGGQMWPTGGAGYTAMETVLTDWAADSAAGSSSSSSSGGTGSSSSSSSSSGGTGCGSSSSSSSSSSGGTVGGSSSSSSSSGSSGVAGGSSSGGGSFPLLGSSHGGHLWGDYCANNGTPLPDTALLPPDPRSLIQPGVNQNKAVYFNAYWKSCHPASNPLQDQAPKTCGDWRTRVASGAALIAGNGAVGAGSAFAGDAAGPAAILSMPGSAYNTLWQAWGLKSRPANYDQLLAQRYGFALSDLPNPYPVTGEDPNQTNGGSGQLPMAFTQLRNADGSWSGKIGVSTCNACHAGRIDAPAGTPQIGAIYGTDGIGDLAILLRDLGKGAVAFLPFEMNRTRGTGNITNFQLFGLLTIEDPQMLAHLPSYVIANFAPSTGTEDPPVWWNLGHRPLKFYDGGEPADATRIELSADFPLFVNPGAGNLAAAEAWTQAHEMDSDAWLLSLKAPSYPYGFCSNADGTPAAGDNPACINMPLAQQGAILFHSKNLWDPALNNPVPKPDGGNGSCASCHGAYSPQYANDPTYLDSPALEGVAGNVVPQNVIATDPERLNGNSNAIDRMAKYDWFAYSDMPQAQCGDQNTASIRGTRALGYLAPPLYGVWATAPYFHNGSVPSVWDVLKPSDRPTIWRRVSAPAIPGSPSNAIMGYDTDFGRAYDTQHLGWDYDTLTCGMTGVTPYVDCNPADPNADPLLQKLLSGVFNDVALLWNIVNLPILSNQQIEDRKIYNTHMFSQGNQGHQFTSVLTDAERKALIEYLKTL